MRASVLLGSGFNAGVGFGCGRFSLSLNLDILNDQGSASASALMCLPGECTNSLAYVGAGATWELERAVHPSLTAGAEYRFLFAEYEGHRSRQLWQTQVRP